MYRTQIKRIWLLAGLAAVFAVLLAACGGDDPTAAPTATSVPVATTAPATAAPATTAPATAAPATKAPATATPTAMMEDKPKLIFADLNWSTALLQNAAARLILEEGYGYETDAVSGSTIPLMQALVAGDLNVNLEIWLPNQQAAYDKADAEGTISRIGKSIDGSAWQSGFLIPQYTQTANPGLTSVEDLKNEEYWSLFVRADSKGKAGLVTCIPGWECEKANERQVYGYGLSDVIELINPGSYEGLNAEIIGAFAKEEDILFYYWGPETLPAKLTTTYGGFYRLEEPPYTEDCWEYMSDIEPQDAERACGYPDAEVLVVVRSELLEEAPDAIAFLENWTLSISHLDAMLAHLDETGDEYSDVAAWWLAEDNTWQDWVTADAAAKILAAIGS